MGKRLDTGKAYGVGYGRPPREHQFQKGQSGNPKGRPKRTINYEDLLLKELQRTVVITENGRPKTITRLDAAVRALVIGAAKGDIRKLKLLLQILPPPLAEAFVAETGDLDTLRDLLEKTRVEFDT